MIGYLMLWECPSLDKKKSIGVDAHSYDSPKEVIIDGQQRLTSLYAVMKGKKVINSTNTPLNQRLPLRNTQTRLRVARIVRHKNRPL